MDRLRRKARRRKETPLLPDELRWLERLVDQGMTYAGARKVVVGSRGRRVPRKQGVSRPDAPITPWIADQIKRDVACEVVHEADFTEADWWIHDQIKRDMAREVSLVR